MLNVTSWLSFIFKPPNLFGLLIEACWLANLTSLCLTIMEMFIWKEEIALLGATNTTGEGATSLELLESGNLVLHGDNGRTLWQSFCHPTDTLLSGQEFVERMNLKSFPRKDKSDYLKFKSGDLVLHTEFQTPQTYWSLQDEIEKTSKNFTGKFHSARLVSDSWSFYDQNKVLLWQFNFSQNSDVNVTWAAKLGSDGEIVFYNLHLGSRLIAEAIKIPQNPYNVPQSCPSFMVSRNESGLQNQTKEASKNEARHVISVVIIPVATFLVFAGLLYWGFYYCKKQKRLLGCAEENWEEDNLLDGFSGMPVRYTYNELCKATNNFSKKVGQGGFGSVYQGVMPDGTQLAVKKLEGAGQGKKEFKAEVRTIGSIHHIHLVKLKGFCTEGVHRILVYEFMGKRSLDKWIFKNNEESIILDWNTRFNIALGTANGLAYLHEQCELKIVHCDIKPENVLLDYNFNAKVSHFGLAKLMSREESLVFTTLRGTRGYLAPEWISNNPISEKSDVFSYGIVLLEIVAGRRSFDPKEIPEKAHLPPFAFKMLERTTFETLVTETVFLKL
ncbi:hypothetical protein PTKIN_Ptkin13bG0136000 [Pterospermum kingtungense]